MTKNVKSLDLNIILSLLSTYMHFVYFLHLHLKQLIKQNTSVFIASQTQDLFKTPMDNIFFYEWSQF